MKFIKVLWFDLKNGYFKGVSCYIFPLFIAIIGFFELHRRIAIWGTEVALGDYWMYLYGGMKEYIPTTGNPFQFPTMWIAVFLFSSFAVLNYPMKDLQNMGTQILVHVQGRTKWWISKCLWNVLSTVLYHGIILLVLVMLCICFQEPLSFEAHADSIATMFGLWVSEFRGGGVIPIAVILTPVILSIAINLLQMVLLLFTKPVFSFLVICIMMLSSAYFLSDIMIGNFAMPIRYEWAIENGVSYQKGLLFSFGILFIAFICGIMKFRRYDILNKEEG